MGAIIFYIATGVGSVPHYNIRVCIYTVYRVVFIGIYCPSFQQNIPCFLNLFHILRPDIELIYTVAAVVARYWDLL